MANLSRDYRFKVPRPQESSTIAVCVHGGELTLSRLWGSVIVELEFDKTEVQFYEAERLVHFKNLFILLDIFQIIYSYMLRNSMSLIVPMNHHESWIIRQGAQGCYLFWRFDCELEVFIGLYI